MLTRKTIKKKKLLEKKASRGFANDWDDDIFYIGKQAWMMELVLTKTDFPRRWDITTKRVPERDKGAEGDPVAEISKETAETIESSIRKGRGRPKGSRNKHS